MDETCLPYKPLGPRLMVPVEWPIQEHHHCEDIEGHIQGTHEKPALEIIIVGMKYQEKEWDGIVSKLNQWRRN